MYNINTVTLTALTPHIYMKLNSLILLLLVLLQCLLCFLTTSIRADIGQYDFGDKSSETLTAKAWNALNEKDYQSVIVYTKKCISLYEAKAKMQQNHLRSFPEGDETFEYWALNDVATCYYILGEAYFAQKKYRKAKKAYEKVVRNLNYAQFYDPGGFFVKVADCCQKKLAAANSLLSITEKKNKTPEQPQLKKLDIREKLEEMSPH